MEKDEISIADVKVVEIDLCTKCKEPLKSISLGGDSLFGIGSSKGAFYCQNKTCDFFGFLTVARFVKTEKTAELKK